ncbi:hypothetical protein ACFVL4_24335 [Bacillus subtilis]|uniref:Glycosaminoglycan attachment site n=1 Tax=Bacillus subtilis subsp. subtilis TaxID=135461 RepID=A0ABD3ZRJ6_BACIU|nr:MULTISPECIES: hypothetical protein [Bacillus]AYK55918.1 hypothetical protein D9C10_01200 [Bacillus subtilis subsp. subtilis]KIL30741.1 hypothetical protein B4067_4770 [Bacillus subtilis subsp. subtilis]KIN26288.1 hypothetical protein B4068_0568 [Bacillus subtilis]KIN26924.1 hypothetical protein B4069_0611 [Bacillus subtilis]KIN37835.1 hypothetical protein B4070_0645 [Bacillus subtilis]
MDLFSIQVNEDKLHPNFLNVSNDPDLVKVLSSWAMGFQDRDHKFVKEFQTTFNTSFWELYLHACFSNLGFKIDYSYSSPDFVIKTRKQKLEMVIEAVSTRHAEDGTPEYERINAIDNLYKKGKIDTEYHKEIVHLATERLASSISNKANKYYKTYSKLDHVKGKPFILAVGSFEQPFFYLQGIGAIQRVLYGLVNAEWRGNVPYFEYSDNILKRKNGKKIPIGLFNDQKYSYISGILFSSVASIGKVRALSLNKKKNVFFNTYTYNDYDTKGQIKTTPHKKYKESLLDGLSLYLNPYADNPIDPTEFDSNDIAIVHSNELAKLKHGFVYSRTVYDISER